MAEITVQRGGVMLRALFKILETMPDGIHASDALKGLEQVLDLTPFEKADYPQRPGVRRFEKLVRFHSINAVKAGWMVKSGGVWTITGGSRSAVAEVLKSALYAPPIGLPGSDASSALPFTNSR